MTSPACIAILGPTCCWKSQLALDLAERFNGEIISCDSMQVYRTLDIGTAKASIEDRARIPHHLIDVLDITEPYDANRFVSLATDAIADIQARGRLPILAGGTGLYARALIYGFSMLPASPQVFQKFDEECKQIGGREKLLAYLENGAKQNNSTVPEEYRLNPRRLIRACEVLELTGKPPWLIATKSQMPKPGYLQFCIVPPLEMAKQRIRIRTRKMLEDGWIEEARRAEQNGLLQTPTARQALGYADIIQALHNGMTAPVEELAVLLANKTIQYARRQLTWFKHQHPGACLLEPPDEQTAYPWLLEQTANAISNSISR